MPDATDLSVRGSEVNSGFWIRRVASPAAAAAAARTRRLVRLTDNKENVPPPGYVAPSPWRRRKSTLPEWYPRTPLRDITAIVNALERRRLRVQAARGAQANRDREASHENTPIGAQPQELGVTDQDPHADSTPNHTDTCIASLSPVEHPLQTPSTCSTSQSDQSPVDMQQIEIEEKLCRSIEQIEKIVNKNMKRTAREASAKRTAQRRTLMSMR